MTPSQMTGELDGKRILFNNTNNVISNSYDTYFEINIFLFRCSLQELIS